MTVSYPTSYFNRFDKAKNYKKLLFLSGSALQSAELNEVQELVLNELAAISTRLISNGTILSGGSIEELTSTSIKLSSATVFADGFSIQIDGNSVAITGSGTEIIGMATSDSMVTYLEDPELLEQDSSSPNYQTVGAHRLMRSGRWTLSSSITSSESFFPVITMYNGEITSISSSTDNSTLISKAIGSYDFETRGSYLISGMDVSFSSVTSSLEYLVKVSSGKARVLGSKVTIPYLNLITLDALSDTREVSAEPHIFTGAGTYSLRYTPAAKVTSVQATKRVTESVVHGSYKGVKDLLSNTPVLAIESVTQGSTTYTEGTDYVQNGDYTDWSLSTAASKEVAVGSTYRVTYTYVDTFVPTISDDSTGFIIDSTSTIASGSTMYVDYDYVLKRIDRIGIDQYGSIVVTKGTPGYTSYQAPAKNPNVLSLATVDISTLSSATATQDTVVNVDISTLNALVSRIESLESNVASLVLTEEARSTDPTSTKRGIFVDSFINEDKRDSGATNTAIIKDGILQLKSSLSDVGSITAAKFSDYTETALMSQLYVTNVRTINPFTTSTSPSLATCTLAPQEIALTRWWWYDESTGTTPEDSSITVSLEGMGGGETITTVFMGSTYTTVSSGSGTASVQVNVPAGSSVGSYLCRSVGGTTKNVADGIVSITKEPTGVKFTPAPPTSLSSTWVTELLTSTSSDETDNGDTLAQTFTPNESCDLVSIQIKLTTAPSDDLVVKITECNSHVPDTSEVLGYGRVSAGQSAGWVKIYFDRPVSVTYGTEYAIVLTTTKPTGAVATAIIGGIDSTQNKTVTEQPNTGVLLVSAGSSAWTTINDEDLSFVLYKAAYTKATKTVTLFSFSGNNMTDFVLSGRVYTPSGTSVRFYLLDTSSNETEIVLNEKLFTSALTGTVKLMAEITTSSVSVSPIIYEALTLMGGSVVSPGIYTSVSFTIPNGSSDPATIKVVLDEYLPSGTSVDVKVGPSGTHSLGLYTTSEIGDDWIEGIYTSGEGDGNLAANTSKLVLTLSTTSETERPQIKSLILTAI